MEITQVPGGSSSGSPTLEQKAMNASQASSTDLEFRTDKPARADNTEPVTGIKFTMLLLSLTSASLPTVTKVGYVTPFALVRGTLSCISSGLFSLFQPHTLASEWVGFSIITGLGRGIALHMPLIAIQSAVSTEKMSQAMAFTVWRQYIGPTIFLTLYNTIFDTSLRSQLRHCAPDANAELIIAAGATRFRSFVSPQDLPGVLRAFSTSLDHTFYLQAAAGVVAWCAAWGMG